MNLTGWLPTPDDEDESEPSPAHQIGALVSQVCERDATIRGLRTRVAALEALAATSGGSEGGAAVAASEVDPWPYSSGSYLNPPSRPIQSEDLRVNALILAIMDLGDDANIELTEDEARLVLARVDVRDPLRPWVPAPVHEEHE